MDQAGPFEHLHVLGGRRQRHREGRGQLAHRQFAPGKPAEHGPSGVVRQGVEQPVHIGRIYNHVVEDNLARISQPIG